MFMKTPIFLLILLGMCATLNAQSSLTVFSNETEFILYVNGQRKNADLATNVRATGINADFVKVKLTLKDPSTPEVTSSISLAQNDDATFELKKNKKGKYVLRFVSGKLSADEGATITDSDEKPAPKSDATTPMVNVSEKKTIEPAAAEEVTITQTQTSTSNSMNGSITINAGGEKVSMNMTISEPAVTSTTVSSTVTTTSTTTSSSNRNTTQYNEEEVEPAPSKGNNGDCAYSYLDFKDAIATIKSNTFTETQMSIAKQVTKDRCLTADQVTQIVNVFSMDEPKLEYAKYAYRYISDKKQAFKIVNAFSFESTKEEFTEFLDNQK